MGKLKKQAKQFGKLEVAPEKSQALSELRQARSTHRQEVKANASLARGLGASIDSATEGLKTAPGINPRDLGIALTELANKRVNNAGGAVLRRSAIDQSYAGAKSEGAAKLRELASKQGLAAAEHLGELRSAAADRKIEQQKVDISQQGLALDRLKLAAQIASDKAAATGRDPKEIVKVKQTFNSLLSGLRQSTITPKDGSADVPLTPKLVAADYQHYVDAMTTEAKGDKRMAQLVVDKYVGRMPTPGTVALMKKTGLTFGYPKSVLSAKPSKAPKLSPWG